MFIFTYTFFSHLFTNNELNVRQLLGYLQIRTILQIAEIHIRP